MNDGLLHPFFIKAFQVLVLNPLPLFISIEWITVCLKCITEGQTLLQFKPPFIYSWEDKISLKPFISIFQNKFWSLKEAQL